jgi:hypothetical protein
MRIHNAERAAVGGHRTDGKVLVCEGHRDALRRIDRQDDPDQTVRCHDRAIWIDARSGAGRQDQIERVRAVGRVDSIRGNESPIEAAAEAEELPQALVLALQNRDLEYLECQAVPLRGLALARQPGRAPPLSASLKAHERDDDRPSHHARDRLAHCGGRGRDDQREND